MIVQCQEEYNAATSNKYATGRAADTLDMRALKTPMVYARGYNPTLHH